MSIKLDDLETDRDYVTRQAVREILDRDWRERKCLSLQDVITLALVIVLIVAMLAWVVPAILSVVMR